MLLDKILFKIFELRIKRTKNTNYFFKKLFFFVELLLQKSISNNETYEYLDLYYKIIKSISTIENKSYDKIKEKKIIDLYLLLLKGVGIFRYGSVEKDINRTSVSDDNSYPNFCLIASLNSLIFENFRSNEIYKQILEHVTPELGEEYFNEIDKNNKNLLSLENINNFKQNDLYGGPQLFNINFINNISPTTLRYVKVLSDIEKFFKNLDNKNIYEIGVGYGGQARILSSYFKINEYTLIDLKQVLLLAQKYLENYKLNTTLIYKTMGELCKITPDFIISNYAFSELTKEIQNEYLEKVILNSKSGYITYNNINPVDFNSYTIEELLNILPNNPRIIDELPKTGDNNCIIIWGI